MEFECKFNIFTLLWGCFFEEIAGYSATYAKSDFVPGDEIIFEDLVEGERVGEFPSRWDILGGEECQIVKLGETPVIKLSGWYTEIAPLMKEADYLPEEFTSEGRALNRRVEFVKK